MDGDAGQHGCGTCHLVMPVTWHGAPPQHPKLLRRPRVPSGTIWASLASSYPQKLELSPVRPSSSSETAPGKVVNGPVSTEKAVLGQRSRLLPATSRLWE